jgi:CRISPR-associated protein Csd2
MKPNRSIIINIDEIINSNPNGDPARNAEPRIDPSGYGYITPMARRKKQRLIIENKEGAIWKSLQSNFKLTPKNFGIAKSDRQDQKELAKLSASDSEKFLDGFWDARIFGITSLYEGSQGMKMTGIVQTSIGRSVSPLPPVTYATCTVSYGIKEGQECSMAPDSIKVIPYAIYKTVEGIDGFLGERTRCTDTDLQVLKAIAPYVWTANRSQSRNCVRPIHIHCITFKNPLDMRCDAEIEELLTPKLKPGVKIGTCRDDFTVPAWTDIKTKYEKQVVYEDLVQSVL